MNSVRYFWWMRLDCTREAMARTLLSMAEIALQKGASAAQAASPTAYTEPTAIAWLKANFRKPLRLDEFAEIARMGISTLHHRQDRDGRYSEHQYRRSIRDGLDARFFASWTASRLAAVRNRLLRIGDEIAGTLLSRLCQM
ncbi:MAG TPA: hypothetical protein VGV15_20455 [Terriglobales bacterium]|nr:hypothetical protein [Terriglobales bacterium]